MLRASSNTACHTCDGCDGDTTVWENERLALSHSCLALILESKTDMKRFGYGNRSLSVVGRPHDSCFRHISADDDGYCQPCRGIPRLARRAQKRGKDFPCTCRYLCIDCHSVAVCGCSLTRHGTCSSGIIIEPTEGGPNTHAMRAGTACGRTTPISEISQEMNQRRF